MHTLSVSRTRNPIPIGWKVRWRGTPFLLDEVALVPIVVAAGRFDITYRLLLERLDVPLDESLKNAGSQHTIPADSGDKIVAALIW